MPEHILNIEVTDLPTTITINVVGEPAPVEPPVVDPPVEPPVEPPKPNVDPLADFTFITMDKSVTFTGLASDEDGTIAAYAWDFGDGNTSTEQSPSHTYTSGMAAKYKVTLEVTDDRGGTAVATHTVSIAPQSHFSEKLLASVKAEIAKNPNGLHAKHFADMIANGKPNISGWRTSATRKCFSDPNYIAAPAAAPEAKVQFSYPGKFPSTFGHDAYGQNFTDDCNAISALAIRSKLDPDSATADRCAKAAIAILKVWVAKLEYVDSQWDNGLSTGRLWWGWGWQVLGPALSLIWNHPDFTDILRNDLTNWIWVVGLDKSTDTRSNGIVYDPEDGHWIRGRTYKSYGPGPAGSGITNQDTPAPGITCEGNLMAESAGSNHILTYWMACVHMGFAIGGDRGKSVADSAIKHFREQVKSTIYYTGDSHHVAGAGFPQSPQPPGYPNPNPYDTADEIQKYWFHKTGPAWDPQDGMSEEIGRDQGHQRMSAYVFPCFTETVTQGGLWGDFYTDKDSGVANWVKRCVAGEELDGGWYRDVRDHFGSPIPNTSSDAPNWTPGGKYTGGVTWAGKNVGTNAGIPWGGADRPSHWATGGNSADRGRHVNYFFFGHLKGNPMPNTKALCDILAGTGPVSATNAAGVGIIRASNQFTWEALLFTPTS